MLSTNKHTLRLARHARLIRCTPKRAASTSVIQETDIVIVGGGPAGLALASALSEYKAFLQSMLLPQASVDSQPTIRNTLKVSLVEASDLEKVRGWTPPPGTFSNRVSSITNASQAFLGGAQGCAVCVCLEDAQGRVKRSAHGRT